MFAYSPDETIYPLLSEKSDFQGPSCWEPSLDHATPSFDIRLWTVKTVSYGAYFPNARRSISWLKIKQFRFAYLESFIFYTSQRREWSRKQMQLSWLFAMLALVSDWFQFADFRISGFPCFRVSAFPVYIFIYGRKPAVSKPNLLEFYGIWHLRDWNMARFESQCH